MTTDEIELLDTIFGQSSRLRYIFESALKDQKQGRHDRLYKISSSGAILRSNFGGTNIFYAAGSLTSSDAEWIFTFPEPGEVHALPTHEGILRIADSQRRITSFKPVHYYFFDSSMDGGPDPRCRQVKPEDHRAIEKFIAAFSDDPIYYEGMLDLPAFGIWENDRLVAFAGTLFMDHEGHAGQIGGFLTDPSRRGQGLATALGKTLIQTLIRLGVKVIRLEVYADNIVARRIYEKLGFKQEDLAPMAIIRGVQQGPFTLRPGTA